MCSTSRSTRRWRCSGRRSSRGGGQGAPKKTLRELAHEGATLKVLAGRYGPYVTDGTTNASIPKGANPEALTYEQAQELLEARRDAAPSPKRAAARGRAGGAKQAAAGSAKGRQDARVTESRRRVIEATDIATFGSFGSFETSGIGQ